MPEGHTIHRLAKDLNASLRSAPVVATSPQGPFAEQAEMLNGNALIEAQAWGKHLFLEFENSPLLHIHLGLIGKLRPKPLETPETQGSIRLRLEGNEQLWDLTGPMTCALIDDDDAAAITAKLGPDSLRRDGVVEVFVQRMSRNV